MKRFFILFIFLHFAAFAQKIETRKIHSKILNQERELMVYVPVDYDENKQKTYDVVYVFDAQNRELFDYTHASLSFINTSKASYIVVGVTSPYIESLDYSRNNDMLTRPTTQFSKDKFGNYAGNADNFLLYIQNEAVPYIEREFRVTENRIAVGHSNSAFFLLHTFLEKNAPFDNYICISPNFAYNDEELLKGFSQFDFKGLKKQKFLYLSNATEEENKGWESWKPARIRAYDFLKKTSERKSKLSLAIEEFPDENHWSTFAPSLTKGLKAYFAYLEKLENQYSDETYPACISITVPNKDDIVYITGNQPELGNWNPMGVKMNTKSDFVREITLQLHNPAQLKFTKGSWATEAKMKTSEKPENTKIDLAKSETFDFTVIGWGAN